MDQEEFRKLRNELKERHANSESVVICGSSIAKTKQSNQTFSKSAMRSTSVGNGSQLPDTYDATDHE